MSTRVFGRTIVEILEGSQSRKGRGSRCMKYRKCSKPRYVLMPFQWSYCLTLEEDLLHVVKVWAEILQV